jgi:hypothetical protein
MKRRKGLASFTGEQLVHTLIQSIYHDMFLLTLHLIEKILWPVPVLTLMDRPLRTIVWRTTARLSLVTGVGVLWPGL